MWVTEENRTRMKKLFIGTTKLGETQHHKVRNIQTTPDFLSATVAMLVIFGIERYFCIISDCRNSFINKPLVGGYYDMGGHYDIGVFTTLSNI